MRERPYSQSNSNSNSNDLRIGMTSRFEFIGFGSLVVVRRCVVSRVEKNRVELLETPGSWHKVVRYLRRVNAAAAWCRASSLLILSSRFIFPRRFYRSCTHDF